MRDGSRIKRVSDVWWIQSVEIRTVSADLAQAQLLRMMAECHFWLGITIILRQLKKTCRHHLKRMNSIELEIYEDSYGKSWRTFKSQTAYPLFGKNIKRDYSYIIDYKIDPTRFSAENDSARMVFDEKTARRYRDSISLLVKSTDEDIDSILSSYGVVDRGYRMPWKLLFNILSFPAHLLKYQVTQKHIPAHDFSLALNTEKSGFFCNFAKNITTNIYSIE